MSGWTDYHLDVRLYSKKAELMLRFILNKLAEDGFIDISLVNVKRRDDGELKLVVKQGFFKETPHYERRDGNLLKWVSRVSFYDMLDRFTTLFISYSKKTKTFDYPLNACGSIRFKLVEMICLLRLLRGVQIDRLKVNLSEEELKAIFGHPYSQFQIEQVKTIKAELDRLDSECMGKILDAKRAEDDEINAIKRKYDEIRKQITEENVAVKRKYKDIIHSIENEM
jgi:hypothetical protein